MTQLHTKSLVWIRRDLRLLDHSALSQATQHSKAVAVAFVFDTEILRRLKNKEDRRLTFIFDCIEEVNADLKKMGSELIIRFGNPSQEIPRLVDELNFEALYYNEDYEPYAMARDQKVVKSLKKIKVPSYASKDHVIFSGDEVLKPDSTAYQMFTPYKKSWLRALKTKDFELRKVGKNFVAAKDLKKVVNHISLEDIGFKRSEFFYDFQIPGRKNAVKQIKKFANNIKDYKDERDFPALPGTSGLSAHLRFGTLSIRECVRMSLKSRSLGNQTWLSELIWRDFYQMILFKYPHVTNSTFKEKCKNLKWKGSNKHFQLLCK